MLVPALAARLREEPDPDGPLHRACTGLLERLGLEDEVRLLTDPDSHGTRTPPPETPGEPGDDGPGSADGAPGGGEPADGKAGSADEETIEQAVRRSAPFMRRAAPTSSP